ncbi:MAG: hypothetical protein AAF799_19270 [Myxococcota bacterium]
MVSAILLAWAAALNTAPPELPNVPGERPEPVAEEAAAGPEAPVPVQTPTASADEVAPPSGDSVPSVASPEQAPPVRADGVPAPASVEEAPAAGPPPTPLCECDELDWQCRQNAGPACNVAPPPPTTVAPESAPLSSQQSGRVEALEAEDGRPTTAEPEPETEARGVFVSFGGGFGICRQDGCVSSPMLFVGRLSTGYRLPHVAITANGMLGGGPQSGGGGGVMMMTFDAGIDVFPVGGGRVDPYVGAGLGYMRVTEFDNGSGSPSADVIDQGESLYSRPALRFSGGIPVMLDSGWALGPRFDYAWGFMGSYCSRRGSCESISSRWPDDPEARRSARNDLPKPWTVTIEARRRF